MAKTILTATLIVLLNVLVGCETMDMGRGQRVPTRTGMSLGSGHVAELERASESEIVEQVAVNRQAYRQSLELLVKYYTRTGDHLKLTWAKKELKALNSMLQYNYIVEAGVAGPGLKATDLIPEADQMYEDAMELEKQGGFILKNNDLLRLALDKYNQLIKSYPSSNKIDDAAYRAGQIYERFKDYTIALVYYQRTYQWDAATIYPARFREAFILDKHLHRRAEALAAYERAVKSITMEGEHHNWMKFAQRRISELTKSEEQGK